VKITKKELRQIIAEELANVLNEVDQRTIAIYADGEWRDHELTDEEANEIHASWDSDHERYSDVVARILSSMHNMDVEDVGTHTAADHRAAEAILARRMGSYVGTTLPDGRKIK